MARSCLRCLMNHVAVMGEPSVVRNRDSDGKLILVMFNFTLLRRKKEQKGTLLRATTIEQAPFGFRML